MSKVTYAYRKGRLVRNLSPRAKGFRPNKLDPSRTLALRRAFSQELRRRFGRLKAAILKKIGQDNALALQVTSRPTTNTSSSALELADFVRLPDGVTGTNCSNCLYEDDGNCTHPRLTPLAVTRRDCCAYWDAEGTGRPRHITNEFNPDQPRDEQGRFASTHGDIQAKGIASGTEHFAVMDRTGKVLAEGEGDAGSADAGGHAGLYTAGAGLHISHNHPDNSVLSPQDFKAFDTYRGVDAISAVTHDGTIHEAKVLGDRRELSKAVDAELGRITEVIADEVDRLPGGMTDDARRQIKAKRTELMSGVGARMAEKGLVSLSSRRLTDNEFNPDQPRDEHGRFTGGGAAPSGMMARTLATLKGIPGAAHRLEMSIAAYVKDEGGKALASLPFGLQEAIHTGMHGLHAVSGAAFATWRVGQLAVEQVAKERGMSDKEAARVRGVMSALDIATFKPVSIGLLASGVSAATAGAISFLPPASMAYLAYSSARHPMATLRAAKSMVTGEAFRHREHKEAPVSRGPSKAQLGVEELVRHILYNSDGKEGVEAARLISDALEAHNYVDWYIALLSAALDEHQDLREAIRVADSLYEQHPRDHSEPADDDAEALGFPPTSNRDWEFHTDPRKLEEFQAWLRTQFTETGLTDEELWKRYIQEGFRKGAGRAFDDATGAKRAAGGRSEDFYEGGREQFLASAFGRPVARERVELLASRAYDELENVTDDMANKMSRALTDGMVEGKGADAVARDMANQVDISRERAEVISRTEIIRAHAEGQLSSLEAMGVEEVGVEVEFLATDDSRVCPECEALQGAIYSIEDAHGVLPVHPQCRCAFAPVVPQPKGEKKEPEEEDGKGKEEESTENTRNANPDQPRDEQGRFSISKEGGFHVLRDAKYGSESRYKEKATAEAERDRRLEDTKPPAAVASPLELPHPQSASVKAVPAADLDALAAAHARLDQDGNNYVHTGELRKALGWTRERLGAALVAGSAAGRWWTNSAEGYGGINKVEAGEMFRHPSGEWHNAVSLHKATSTNAFCPTGPGGGVDPTCSPGNHSVGDTVSYRGEPGWKIIGKSKSGDKVALYKSGQKIKQSIPVADLSVPAAQSGSGDEPVVAEPTSVSRSTPALTEEEKGAVIGYSENWFYGINRSLRGSPTSDPVLEKTKAERVSLIDSAIGKSRLSEDTTLYRGIFNKILKRAKVGSTVTDSAFTSTTVDKGLLDRSGRSKLTIVKIEAPKGTTALHVDPLLSKDRIEKAKAAGAGPGTESEVLLPRGTKLTVTSVRHEKIGKKERMYIEARLSDTVENRSFFAECDRDEHGWCLPGEGGGDKVSREQLLAIHARIREKYQRAPKPSKEDRDKALAGIAAKGANKYRRDLVGNNKQRAARKEALLKEFGDGKSCPCCYCARKLGEGGMPVEQDKLYTTAQGGKYRLDNLIPACKRCNGLRGDVSFKEIQWPKE